MPTATSSTAPLACPHTHARLSRNRTRSMNRIDASVVGAARSQYRAQRSRCAVVAIAPPVATDVYAIIYTVWTTMRG